MELTDSRLCSLKLGDPIYLTYHSTGLSRSLEEHAVLELGFYHSHTENYLQLADRQLRFRNGQPLEYKTFRRVRIDKLLDIVPVCSLRIVQGDTL